MRYRPTARAPCRIVPERFRRWRTIVCRLIAKSLATERPRHRREVTGVYLKRFERDDRACVDDAGDRLHLLTDEVADVDVFIDVKLRKYVEIPGDRVYFRGDLGFGERACHRVRLAECAFELDEKGLHR